MFDHALWVQNSHLGPRQGSLWVLLEGLGGYTGSPFGNAAPCWAILGPSCENSRDIFVNFEHRDSCEVEIVDLIQVLLVCFRSVRIKTFDSWMAAF